MGMSGLMKTSKTALFEAAKRWDVKSLTALLSAAPDLIDATDPRGRKALHIACSVKPGTAGTREPNGMRTVSVLFRRGAGLHARRRKLPSPVLARLQALQSAI